MQKRRIEKHLPPETNNTPSPVRTSYTENGKQISPTASTVLHRVSVAKSIIQIDEGCNFVVKPVRVRSRTDILRFFIIVTLGLMQKALHVTEFKSLQNENSEIVAWASLPIKAHPWSDELIVCAPRGIPQLACEACEMFDSDARSRQEGMNTIFVLQGVRSACVTTRFQFRTARQR